MSTDENNCLSHSVLITLNNFKRISLNNTHTHRDHDGHGQAALASQQCKNNNTVQWLVPVITLVATASNDFVRGCRSNAAAAGLTFRCRGQPKPLPLAGLKWFLDDCFQQKKQNRTIDLWSQHWWRMVPDNHPPRSQWSHKWWGMVPTHM